MLLIPFNSGAQTYVISGESDPCPGDTFDYTVRLSSMGLSCPGSCTDINGKKHESYIDYSWNTSNGTIVSEENDKVRIKWFCDNITTSTTLTWKAVCFSYTYNPNTGACDAKDPKVLETINKTIYPKCPPPSALLSGATYIPCCDTASYNYSADVGIGNYSYEWILPPGWEINSGQGTANINVTPANGPSGAKIIFLAWASGCDKTKANTRAEMVIDRVPPLTKTGNWPNVICRKGLATLCTNALPCATYNWQLTVDNLKSRSTPTVQQNSINQNCITVELEQKDTDENFGYVDFTITATSPCGLKNLTHRIFVPGRVPKQPQIDWDGDLGYLCVCRRNVLFWITNDEPGNDQWEWTFDNGSSTYTEYGPSIGTDFCNFGSGWAQNPNSNVTVKVRMHNACGWSNYKTLTISAARFRNIASADCGNYPASPAPLNIHETQMQNGSMLQINPNPAADLLILQWNTKQTGHLFIYTIAGKLVYEQPELISGKQISTQKLAPGQYLIRLTTGNKLYTNRLIIQRN